MENQKPISLQFLDTVEDQHAKLCEFFKVNGTSGKNCVAITLKFDTLVWEWMDKAKVKGVVDEEIKEGFNNEFIELMANLNK